MSARRYLKTAPQRRKKQKLISTFLILALVSILLGYLLGKYFIYRTVNSSAGNKPEMQDEEQNNLTNQARDNKIENDKNKTDEEQNDEKPSLDLALSPIQFYQVQVGAFQSMENASKLLADLNNQGISEGTVVFVSPYYRVRIGILGSRGEAEELIRRLSALDYQGFIIQRTINQTYKPQGKEVYLVKTQEAIKACSNFINKLTAINFGSGYSFTSADLQELNQLIDAINEKGKMVSTLDSIPSSLTTAHEQLIKILKIAEQLKEPEKNQSKILDLVENYCIFEEKLSQ